MSGSDCNEFAHTVSVVIRFQSSFVLGSIYVIEAFKKSCKESFNTPKHHNVYIKARTHVKFTYNIRVNNKIVLN